MALRPAQIGVGYMDGFSFEGPTMKKGGHETLPHVTINKTQYRSRLAQL